MKLYGKCSTCHEKRFLLKKATVIIPVGTATSKDDMCRKCRKDVEGYFNSQSA